MDIIQQFAALVAKRVVAQLKNGHKKSSHKLDMKCRVPHCRERSRGPRFRYICRNHGETMTLAQQRKALANYNARKANGG